MNQALANMKSRMSLAPLTAEQLEIAELKHKLNLAVERIIQLHNENLDMKAIQFQNKCLMENEMSWRGQMAQCEAIAVRDAQTIKNLRKQLEKVTVVCK